MNTTNSSARVLADFARISFEHGLVSVAALQKWGDALIESTENPPAWMIDLAFATRESAFQILRSIPGEADLRKSAAFVCALLQRKWIANQIDIPSVRRVGWDLHCDDLLSADDDTEADWGAALEVLCEGLSEGWQSESEIRDLIAKSLARYNSSAATLPDWVDLR